MTITHRHIILFFRYLWLILAFSLLMYVISNNIITQRDWSYSLDFSESISRDTKGWYPEARVKYLSDDKLLIKGEPIYYQIYMPIEFDTLSIEGNIEFNNETLNLGLKQKDGSWFWQNINSNNVALDFPLQNASRKSNKLEMILSVPDLDNSSEIYLKNDWRLNFKR